MTNDGPLGAAIADNRPMHRLRTSRWNHWIGVFLVLLPLLAPTLSHALRHAGALTSQPLTSGAACLPGTTATAVPATEVLTADADPLAARPSLHADAVDAALHACAYCSCPAFGHAMPTAAAALTAVAPIVEPGTGRPDTRPGLFPFERPRTRAPPAQL